MKIEIEIKDIIANKGVNALGEILRSIFFDQTNGFGCYSSFKLNKNVERLENEIDNFYENDITYTCAQWEDIKMRYYWDGDGYLEFIFKDGTMICNDDCKKDYGWEVL